MLNAAGERFKSQLENFAKANGFDIVDPLDESGYYYSHTGPAEWVYLVEHASLVLANSFHAAVFSLIFNVPFLLLNIGHENMHSRIANLVEQFDLKGVERDVNELSFPEIDFDAVNAKLASERARALTLLADWVHADVQVK